MVNEDSNVGREESTYDSSPNLPNPQHPQTYVSIRVTTPHSNLDKILNVLSKPRESWIVYPHSGSKANNPHFHAAVIASNIKEAEMLRQRFKRTLPDLKGQENLTVKYMTNGILKAIQYMSKEGTKPVYSSDMQVHIDAAPKWEQRTLDSWVKPEKANSEWQLTYCNIVPQAVTYARKKGLTGKSLKAVVQHMLENTNWSVSNYLLNRGVPSYYEERFELKIGDRKTISMDFWTPHNG